MKIIYFANSVMDPNTVNNRIIKESQAGKLRAKYILELLLTCRKNEDIIFLSQALGTSGGLQRNIVVKPTKRCIEQVYIGYLGKKTLQRISSMVFTIIWILKNVTKDDLVIVYNFDPLTAIPVYVSRLFLRFNVIVQFEELYGNFIKSHNSLFKLCESWGIKIGCGFITPSCEIADSIRAIRIDNPPIIMSYGYFASKGSYMTECSCIDEELPVVMLYSGTLDKNRGLDLLITYMPLLEGIAELIITGTGPLENYVKNMAKKSKNIQYMGLLPEDEYNNMFEKVDVCICPTPTNIKFSSYSFPSKVVYYISQYKFVLSTAIKPLIHSPYVDFIQFYDETKPESFVEAIKKISKRKGASGIRAEACKKLLDSIIECERRNICHLLESVKLSK